MNQPELTPSIIMRAVSLFEEPEQDVYSMPALENRPFPVTYMEYDIGSAAIEALLASDFDQATLAAHPLLIEELESEVKDTVEDWRYLVQMRRQKAMILNNYSRQTGFNPN